jgi:DNA-binding CsgD family transcriptional regulator
MNDVEPLTPREQEVLTLVAQGYQNKEIAERLFIATNTVQNHLRSIFAKLGVQSRTQAVFQIYHFVPRDPARFWQETPRETTVEPVVGCLPPSSSTHGE